MLAVGHDADLAAAECNEVRSLLQLVFQQQMRHVTLAHTAERGSDDTAQLTRLFSAITTCMHVITTSSMKSPLQKQD